MLFWSVICENEELKAIRQKFGSGVTQKLHAKPLILNHFMNNPLPAFSPVFRLIKRQSLKKSIKIKPRLSALLPSNFFHGQKCFYFRCFAAFSIIFLTFSVFFGVLGLRRFSFCSMQMIRDNVQHH